MVLGPFVDQVGPTLSDEELDQLEHLLNEEDQYLYAWIIEREPTPPEHQGPVMDRDGLAETQAYLRGLAGDGEKGSQREVIANVFKGVQNRMVSGYLLRDIVNKINAIHFSDP